jgi:DNA-binding XRE family transcriptional regulator
MSTYNLAVLMRDARYQHRITQERLGEIAGLSRGTIRNAEAGKPVNSATETAILDALGLIADLQPGETLGLDGLRNSLRYVGSDGTCHQIDGDHWDPTSLSPRDRAVCRALLTFALGRLNESEVAR